MGGTRDRPCGDRALLVGGNAAAALHPVAERHAARDRVCSSPLHRWRHPDHHRDTGSSGCARAAFALAWLRLTHVVHRNHPQRRLHDFQRMAECRNPAELVPYRGDAGCSFPWHRPDAIPAMADCSRPGTCRHWPPIPPRAATGAVTAANFTLKRLCAMPDSGRIQNLRSCVPVP